MWVSGLRGAMAYALALKAFDDLDIGPIILIDTLIYALLTILGIGSILNPLLTRLGVKRTVDADAGDESDRADANNTKTCFKLKNRIRKFDNEYFSPLFIK